MSEHPPLFERLVRRSSPPSDPGMGKPPVLAEGLSNKEIARRLVVSPRTVSFHLENIYSKLGVNSRTGAAIHALHRGWVRRNLVE